MTETFGEKEEKSEPPPARESKTVKLIRASCIASLLVVKTITETKEDSLVASLCEVIFSVVNLQHDVEGQSSPNPPTPPPSRSGTPREPSSPRWSCRSCNLFRLDRRYQDKTTKVTGTNLRIKVLI